VTGTTSPPPAGEGPPRGGRGPGTTLVFGAGWIGRELAARIQGGVLSRADVADPRAVEAELDRVRPVRVVNAAGKNGVPNVDACEREPEATYRSNVVGPIVLSGACLRRDLHLTHLSSGCLYEGDAGGRGWTEDDPPSFAGSVYARTKAEAEAALRPWPVLQLRMRMPIASVPHPRNLLTKLLGYARVTSVPNSITVLDDAWAAILGLMDRGATGVWNVVSPGIERHDEVLGLWRELVDPTHAFRVVSKEELLASLAAGRSDCVLSTARLEGAGLGLPPLAEALPRVILAYARAAGREPVPYTPRP
jgi:3,5-epimerase/4-reductase